MMLTLSQVKFCLIQSQGEFSQGPGFQTIIYFQRLAQSDGLILSLETGWVFLENSKSERYTKRIYKIIIVLTEDTNIIFYFD